MAPATRASHVGNSAPRATNLSAHCFTTAKQPSASAFNPVKTVAARPGSFLNMVETESAQLAQWEPSRVLTALANPNPPRWNGSVDCWRAPRLTSSGSTPMILHRQWCWGYVAQEGIGPRGGAIGTATTNWLGQSGTNGILVNRVSWNSVFFSRNLAAYSSRPNGTPNTFMPCSETGISWSPLHTIARGSCTPAAAVNWSTPLGFSPLRFQIFVFPQWMSMLVCLCNSWRTISYTAEHGWDDTPNKCRPERRKFSPLSTTGLRLPSNSCADPG